jgi:hypothetical protein
MALTFFGVAEFKRSGPPQWNQSLWGIDTLVVPYSGPIIFLEEFLDFKTKGQPSDIDENMLLTDWHVSDQHKQYPTVDLIYLGKRGGVLPPGKHGSGNAVQAVSSAAGPVSLTYLAPVTTYSWISEEEGVGGLALPPSEVGQSGSYQFSGTTFAWPFGSNVITGTGSSFTSEVRVGDFVTILKIGVSPPEFRQGYVNTVTDDNHLGMVETNTQAPLIADFGVGVHISSTNIKVVSIRTVNLGFGGLLTGEETDKWGPILASTYFVSLVIPTTESEELVPGRYWSNVQRMTTTLLPIFDD